MLPNLTETTAAGSDWSSGYQWCLLAAVLLAQQIGQNEWCWISTHQSTSRFGRAALCA
jgi:hypothetical protein